jgi:hypothetical protein
MLGWHISIYRQTDDGASPATAQSLEGTRVAVWQTGLGGLEWFDELVKAGKAFDLGGDGYPSRYTATAGYVIPQIVDKPPGALDTWMFGADDVLTKKWEGRTVVDRAAVAACRRDEWLLIEAWDES